MNAVSGLHYAMDKYTDLWQIAIDATTMGTVTVTPNLRDSGTTNVSVLFLPNGGPLASRVLEHAQILL